MTPIEWVDIASLGLRPFSMPGGTPDVGLKRLQVDAAGGFVAVVRFPAGFHREASGWYPVDEEFVVLDGDLAVSGRTYVKDWYARIPARSLRYETHSDRGALTVAHFGGAADWNLAAGAAPPDIDQSDGSFTALHWPEAPIVDGPLGQGHLLHAGAGTTIVYPSGPDGSFRTAGWCLDLIGKRFASCPAGSSMAAVGGPLLVNQPAQSVS